MAHAYLDELFSLSGRTALVTGGSSGIGRAIARSLGRAGARVVVVARGEPALRETVAELAAVGCTAGYVTADLSAPAGVDTVTGQEPDIDILVNSAAVNIRHPLEVLRTDDWELTLAVNLTAPYLLGQFYGPRMAGHGYGRIVNIVSQQAVRAFGNSGAYGAAKAGLAGLTRSQAEAWSSRGVCCNAVSPGFVQTPLTRAFYADPDRVTAMAARTMVGRNGEPDDFAGLLVFLASPASAYVTGQTIFVDGGFSVH